MTSPPRFSTPRRSRWRRGARHQPVPALLLDDTLTALGRSHACGPARTQSQTVAVRDVVGTLARADDFDRDLRPTRRHLRERWEAIAALADNGAALPPVSLVRVGQLYFVADGHHRLSVVKARGQLAVDAQVRTLCTIAFACACLTAQHLPLKAAERDFLTAVPLPDPALREVWLDDPADYHHLHAAARAWAAQHADAHPDCCLDAATAAGWWRQHVVPLAHPLPAGSASTAAAYLHALEKR